MFLEFGPGYCNCLLFIVFVSLSVYKAARHFLCRKNIPKAARSCAQPSVPRRGADFLLSQASLQCKSLPHRKLGLEERIRFCLKPVAKRHRLLCLCTSALFKIAHSPASSHERL